MKKAPKEKVYKTSISLPKALHRAAVKKAFQDRRAFSAYVTLLIERDLQAQQGA